MSSPNRSAGPDGDLTAAQQSADRIRLLREELSSEEVQAVLALTPEQQNRFEDWSRDKLASLAQQFDVDTTASQKRVSSGNPIRTACTSATAIPSNRG